MSGTYINRPRPNKWIGIIIDKYYNKTVPKPINLRPGYDIEYIRNRYQFPDKFEKMIEVEKIYDNLSIIGLYETPQQWAIRVRNTLQVLIAEGYESYYHLFCLFGSSRQGITKTYYSTYEVKELVIGYHRPNIHNSKMAICFDCWKLAKIPDVKPKKTYFAGWGRYGYEIEPEDLMKHHWDNECSKAKTEDGSARLIQRAYRNYRKRPISLAKQVWEAVRNDNTPRKKKFLDMPSREIYCTVNLDIWYSINGSYRPYNVPLDQFYDYISYSKHKRRQLSDRLAIVRNQIQSKYTAPEFRNLWNDRLKISNISSSTTLDDLVKAYFDNIRKNA
ncbi:hypothetical protein RclHR1_02650016 [Rhizophagus clarus]|uniref:Uncharacterized protein n=1 Tax=Rhizophagus clarus TaxID=94130 RepID=A0A2Z6R1X3_9GLOM|nr:hypothetical protein RclHR1_02650016 [Rhizophagus clarus]GES83057.1 hypothetical protein GLOIN_2v1792321 [Rhizophagus clarus]GES94125.1 hypothetical protein GLOIN_2v1792321 [Rhizophagus clarus]GES96820.1 hypothetical protein GLOIN_2v1792321 [Rhizophagus clarus]